MITWTRLGCGHLRRTDAADADTECPYCVEYAEAFAQDVYDALFEDESGSVVPHVRS